MFELFLSLIKDLSPVAAIGWITSCAQAILIFKYFIPEIQKMHQDRFEDYKSQTEKLTETIQAVTIALDKLAKKKGPKDE